MSEYIQSLIDGFKSGEPSFLIPQIIGFIAMLSGFISYQCKTRKGILTVQAAGSVLWTTQFLLLNSPTGAILNVLAILRNIVYSFKGKYKWVSSLLVPIITSGVFVVASLITYEGPISLLPMVGMIFSSVALYITNEKYIRLFSLGVCPCWLIYDWQCGSVAGTLTETFNLISILIAIFRYDILKKYKEEKAQ